MESQYRNPVRLWLICVCTLVIAMICVGGITRLTGSGLSIVEWKPIMGAIPPLSAEEWDIVFKKYQTSPQYQVVNQGMSLHEFKKIFFWEYFHRLLGRFIGIAFIIPWLWFVFRRAFDRSLLFKTGVAFILGGLQGALGWYMVKSGLVNVAHVSHFRLAAHLIAALILLVYLFNLYLKITHPPSPTNQTTSSSVTVPKFFIPSLTGFAFLVAAQITYGAFVAGLRAGFAFNTFPKMGESWIPLNLFAVESFWSNWVHNPITVQFTHRTIAWVLVLVFGWLFFAAKRTSLPPKTLKSFKATGVVLALQFILGVLTLILIIPIPVAVAHQIGAFILVLFTLRTLHLGKLRQ